MIATPGNETAREEFTVQGMTGVDLSLQIAGPGSRSYAFIIDWHVRLLIALAWLGIARLLAGSMPLNSPTRAGGSAMVLVVIVPVILYLFYHPVVELLMRGQTPGKRMAGVRVVNRDGGPPSAGAILVRNAFRLIDSLPLFYVVGLVCTFVTAQRVRIGDMAAGTLLVAIDANAGSSIARLSARGHAPGLEPAALDLVEQLLERWDGMDVERRGAIARSLLLRIDANPLRPVAELPDAGLRARLKLLAGGGSPD